MLNLIAKISVLDLGPARVFAQKILPSCIFLGLLVTIGACSPTKKVAADTDLAARMCQLQKNKVITIGALIPLTGAASHEGIVQQALIDVCTKELEANALKDFGITIQIQMADTNSVPTKAVEALNNLAPDSCMVIGPSTSSEAAAALKIANNKGVAIVSTMSTSPALSLNDDNLFRLAPSDSHQGAAIAATMVQDGVKCVIGLERNDVWGNSLYRSIKSAFEKKSGKMSQMVSYNTNIKEFAAQLRLVRSYIRLAIQDCAGGDPKGVAVQLSAFDESVAILEAANDVDIADPEHTLSSVQWYGSDAITQSPGLLANAKAATFAIKARLKSSIFSIPKADDSGFATFASEVKNTTGQTLNTYGANFCDAILLLAKTASLQGENPISINDLRTKIIDVASSTKGITGSLQLDVAGDRALSQYDFYTVAPDEAGYVWKRVLDNIDG